MPVLKAIATFAIAVAFTFVLAGTAYAAENTCEVKIADTKPCEQIITTNDKLIASLDGEEDSVSLLYTNKSSSYGATLTIQADDEKLPDIILRPNMRKSEAYKFRARKVIVENASTNEGVEVAVVIKENTKTTTDLIFGTN